MNEYINIDKLHAVLEGKLIGRNSGQSFARLVQMAQSVEFLPYGKVVHISSNEQTAKIYRSDFKIILNYLGMGDFIVHTYVDSIRFENGCSARFLSASSPQKLVTALRGIKLDNYFIDHDAEYLISDQMYGFIQTRLV